MIARKSLSVFAAAALASSMCMAAPTTAALAAQDDAGRTAAATLATSSANGASAASGFTTAAAKTVTLTALQQKRLAVLTDNLVNRFAVGGTDAAIDNNTVDAALALQQLAELSGDKLKASELIDGAAVLKKLKSDKGLTCGRTAKYLVALNAAGVKQSKYQSYVDAFVSQVEAALKAPEKGLDTRAYSAVWILPALLIYCPDQSSLVEQAVDVLTSAQVATGLIQGDYQTTGQAVWALSRVAADADSTGASGTDAAAADSAADGSTADDTATDAEGVAATEAVATKAKACMDKAVAAIADAQLSSGAWPYSPAYSDKADLDTTGWALFALMLSGDNASYANACASAAAYLQNAVDEDLTYFMLSSPSNEPMTCAAVLLGITSAAKAGVITLDGGTLGTSVGKYLAPNKVTSVAAVSKKSCQIKVTWSNADGKTLAVDGYQVRVLSGGKLINSSSFKIKKTEAKKKVGALKKNYYKLTVPKKGTISVDPKYSGKKLSVYVRAYRVKNNHRSAVYSTKSTTVKVKVK